MKKIFICISLLISLNIYAVTIKFVGPCSPIPFSRAEINLSDFKLNLGQITTDYLTQAKIPFIGDEFGMSSINGSAIGDDAIEVISDTQLRAYGWCVTINNFAPELMPNEILLSNQIPPPTPVRWNSDCRPRYGSTRASAHRPGSVVGCNVQARLAPPRPAGST